MTVEIEKKFLCDKNHPELIELLSKSTFKEITQGYLTDTKDKVFRVRIISDVALLTIKGPRVGISNSEFEYEIPVSDAKELLATMSDPSKTLSKKRYYHHTEDGFTMEIDVFSDFDMVLMEVEFKDDDEISKFESLPLPSFVIKDVSTDLDYTNVSLLKLKK